MKLQFVRWISDNILSFTRRRLKLKLLLIEIKLFLLTGIGGWTSMTSPRLLKTLRDKTLCDFLDLLSPLIDFNWIS